MIYRVLVAVDGTEASNTALEIACALADNYEAALGLLTVLEPDEIPEELVKAAQIEGVIPDTTTYATMMDSSLAAHTSAGVYRDLSEHQKASRLASIIADTIVAKAKAFSADKPFKAIKTFVRNGDPAKAILDCAADNEADLIVMGHDQQGRVEALFKGSVAEKVQRDAACPCLIYCLPKKD